MKKTGVLLSGGVDSSILVAHLLDQSFTVQPFYIRSNLVWETSEYAAANRFLAALKAPGLQTLITLELPLQDLYQGHWSITGQNAPDAESPDSAVFLPGRNALLVIKAALWCQLHDIDRLALAPLRNNPFADATPEFFTSLQAALNRSGLRVLEIIRPFAGMSKQQVLLLGNGYPIELTFSCISPVSGLHCGVCNKCTERKKVFRVLNRRDPTHYVNRAAAQQNALLRPSLSE